MVERRDGERLYFCTMSMRRTRAWLCYQTHHSRGFVNECSMEWRLRHETTKTFRRVSSSVTLCCTKNQAGDMKLV